MQQHAYTHGGTIGIGSNVNGNDFPNRHVSNNSHVLNAIQTSLPQNNNNIYNSNIVATAATTSSRSEETGAVSPNDKTSIGGSTGVSTVNYGPTFFGNEYHHQLTQSALMANTTTYAAAASTAANTAMLTNYCDAAMMMAAAAVNANQCLQQQQQRMALMANCQTALTGGASCNSNNDEHDVTNLNKIASPLNNETTHNGNQRPHHINSSLVSSALSSSSSTTSNTSSSSSLLSSHSSSATTSPSITVVNTASLISTNATINDIAAGYLHPPQSHHQLQQNHQQHLHHAEPPVTSPNLIDISEVPLVVDVKVV